MIIRFKRFSRPQILKRIRPELLDRFFNHFEPELKARNLCLPSPKMDDDTYFGFLTRLLASPEALPDSINEALFGIDELACAEGQEQLELAVARAALPMVFLPDSSSAELALQVWLADPALLARTYNQQRLQKLSAFEHFGCCLRQAEGRAPAEPTQVTVEALVAALDPWFVRHHRGQNTTRIELYPLNGEHWFLVRHGDTFSRTPKVEAQKTEILHFRPERDDVIVYSPEHDELRINARTKGERDLYVKKFGQCLRGSEDYFSQRRTYTLEPLRTEGAEALDPAGIEGISKIVLRQVEVAWYEAGREVLTREADDIFQLNCAEAQMCPPIPEGGHLCRAAFDFHFADQTRPRTVQIRLPNRIKLGRHCDIQLVDRWLRERGFRSRVF
jgi:hypothetical protein